MPSTASLPVDSDTRTGADHIKGDLDRFTRILCEPLTAVITLTEAEVNAVRWMVQHAPIIPVTSRITAMIERAVIAPRPDRLADLHTMAGLLHHVATGHDDHAAIAWIESHGSGRHYFSLTALAIKACRHDVVDQHATEITEALNALPAGNRTWCAYCPDLILEGEPAVTHPDIATGSGTPSVIAHADCAAANGWPVSGTETLPELPPALSVRAALRAELRGDATAEEPENAPVLAHARWEDNDLAGAAWIVTGPLSRHFRIAAQRNDIAKVEREARTLILQSGFLVDSVRSYPEEAVLVFCGPAETAAEEPVQLGDPIATATWDPRPGTHRGGLWLLANGHGGSIGWTTGTRDGTHRVVHELQSWAAGQGHPAGMVVVSDCGTVVTLHAPVGGTA